MTEVLVDLKAVCATVNEFRSKYELLYDGVPASVFELLDKEQYIAAKLLVPTALNKMQSGIGLLFDNLLERLTLLATPVVSVSMDVPEGIPAATPAGTVAKPTDTVVETSP